MNPTIRLAFTYNLYLLALAVFAFWCVYQTLDASFAANLALTEADYQGTVAIDWVSAKRDWANAQLSPFIKVGHDFLYGIQQA